MSTLEKIMRSEDFGKLLKEMDEAGAVSARATFDVEGSPSLGIFVTVGADATTKVRAAVTTLEDAGFEDNQIIPATKCPGGGQPFYGDGY